jgi:pimeloyl-ACP methyl ester carboxylesterase
MIFVLAACGSDLVDDHMNVRTDGAVLPVEVHGNMDSGTLLLVESGGPSGPSIAQRTVGYMPFQDTLEPELAVAFYDRRGTGNATGDYSVDDQSMDQLIADLDAVMAVLDERYAPERLVLMGHSFGTYTSALYQIEHPGKTDAWIAAAPAIIEGPDDFYVPYRRDFACRVADEQIADGSDDSLWTDIEDFCVANPTIPAEWDTPEREELWGYLGQIEDRLEPWPSMEIGGLLGAVFFSHYNIIDAQMRGNRISDRIEADPGREDLLPELGAIDVPAAVITGEYDGTTPTELGTAVVDALPPGAVLTEVAGGGHYMMADDPDAFADAVFALVDPL